ncbi:MAG: type II secretion system F family protein [Terracidiphilus sp.]
MLLLIILVFLAAFGAIAALLMAWSGAGKSRQSKLVLATLESAVGAAPPKPVIQAVNFRKKQSLSSIPWLNRLLTGIDVVPRLQRLLREANLKWTVGALVLMSLACFAIPAFLIHMRTNSAILAILLSLALGFLPLAFVLVKRRKRFAKFEQGLPDALDLMVGALRVGHSFSAALSLVTRECADPIGSEFRICFDEQNFGLDMRTALDHLVERVPLQDLRIVVTAILIQRESGGNLAELLEKAAHVTRQRFRLRRQVMVHTAQGRLTGWILTLLPVALGVGLYIVNPGTMSLLWKRAIGIKLLCIAGGMLVTGTLIIQKIVRMDV